MNKVEKIIERMKQACHASNDSQLVKKLNISTSSVTHWRTRGTIPYEECSKIALSFDVSLDWLIHGNREISNKRQELISKWNSRVSNIDVMRMQNLCDAMDINTPKGTMPNEVARWTILLDEFKYAESVEDFLTILNIHN